MALKANELKEIVALRKLLHQHAELSNEEETTSNIIIRFLKEKNADKIISGLGGHGVAGIFKGKDKGPTILIRCELDALPIQEINNFSYKSRTSGIGHKCGHDGHMAIVSGVASFLKKNKPNRGKAVLLFQPAEETGEGAQQVINDPKFKKFEPDYCYALHNLPGYPKSEIVVRDNIFSAASKGMIAELTGKTSHAGEPEKGITPSLAVASIIQQLSGLNQAQKLFSGLVLLTIIHTRIGEVAFGTTPGEAEVMATLRAYRSEDLDKLGKKAKNIVEETAAQHQLKNKVSWVEEFPETTNDKDCSDLVRACAKENELSITELKVPFRWSEDFGHFTQQFPGALFGLGAGTEQPQLHNPDYDFPDEIIDAGTKMFICMIKKKLGNV